MTVLGSETQQNEQATESEAPVAPERSLRTKLQSMGGADHDILRLAPADAKEFVIRGMAAFTPAPFAAIAFTAMGTIVSHSIWTGIVLGLLVGLVILNLDTSMLGSMTNADWKQKCTILLLRGGTSVLAAIVTAQFLLLIIYDSSIQPQMVKNQKEAALQYENTIVGPQYADDKAAAEKIISDGEAELNAAATNTANLRRQVDDAKNQVSCEVNGGRDGYSGCKGTTGDPGIGDEARIAMDQQKLVEGQLATAEAEERAIQTRLDPILKTAREKLADTQGRIDADTTSAHDRYLADQGIIARLNAFEDLREADPGVNAFSWWLKGLLIMFDLATVISGVISRVPSYRRIQQAMEKEAADRAELMELEAELLLIRRKAEITALTRPDRIAIMQDEREVAATQHELDIEAIDEAELLAEAEARLAKLRARLRGDVALAEADADAKTAPAEDDDTADDDAEREGDEPDAETRPIDPDPDEENPRSNVRVITR